MKTIDLRFSYKRHESERELPQGDRQLVARAVHALGGAYAPYSLFRVGAALLLDDGTIVEGSNQENASFPQGQCAERTALFAASAQFPGKRVMALAVTASPENFVLSGPVTPCGGCRQVISEYEHKQGHPIRILLHQADGPILEFDGIEALLPLGFQEASLKKEK